MLLLGPSSALFHGLSSTEHARGRMEICCKQVIKLSYITYINEIIVLIFLDCKFFFFFFGAEVVLDSSTLKRVG